MSQSALFFPGQGAQTVGMGRDIAHASPRARAVFDRANAALGFNLAELCFEGPAEKLEQTDIQQPAIFVTGVALWEAFLEAGGSRDEFAYAGGLSLGEYTALHVAGAVGFEDGLRLVHRRGQLMQAAADASAGGMVSLIGADEPTAIEVCNRAADGEVLVPANFNCPGQVVISGSDGACKRAVQVADKMSLRAVRLPVAGAFHSPLMEPAACGLAEELSRTELRKPKISVIANVDANYHDEPDAIRDRLSRQLTHPVRWEGCVRRLIGDGVGRTVEVGPGRVLTGLMRKIDRTIEAKTLGSIGAVRSRMAEAARS